jgi:hypothetical protein
MKADEIINSALNSGGKMIGGPNLFILEGNSERNEFRVLTADECFKNNIMAFTYDLRTGFVMLGMYSTRETAEEQIEVIRQFLRDENGNVLL